MKKIRNLLVLTSICTLPARAGDPVVPAGPIPASPGTSSWEFTGTMYAPLMGLDGTIGTASVSGDVDLSFGDILENLDAGLSGSFEARRDRWSVTGDFIWLKISDAAEPTANSEFIFKQQEIMASLSLGYELYGNEDTTLDILAGAAVTSLDVDLELQTPNLPITSRSTSASRTWIDPYIGLRVRHHLSEHWSVFATGVYGGFDVSSEQYWQALAGLSYRLNDHAAIALAYRVIAVDYNRANFVYDTKTSGPNLGLVFKF